MFLLENFLLEIILLIESPALEHVPNTLSSPKPKPAVPNQANTSGPDCRNVGDLQVFWGFVEDIYILGYLGHLGAIWGPSGDHLGAIWGP